MQTKTFRETQLQDLMTMATMYEIKAKARELYLEKYEKEGGRWELVDIKDVWYTMARDWLDADEGTRKL